MYNTQTMLNREYSKGILCHAVLCTQETKRKALLHYEAMSRWKAIARMSANTSAKRNDDDVRLFTIDFFRRGDGEMRKRILVDQRNGCRHFKDRCGSYLSIRVNVRPPLAPPAVVARMQLGRITCKCFAAELPQSC